MTPKELREMAENKALDIGTAWNALAAAAERIETLEAGCASLKQRAWRAESRADETPITDEIHAQITNSGGTSEAAFHDMLNHARQMERERNEWAERWADLNRAAVRESVALEEVKNVLRIVLNGGIDDGLDWQQIMDKVRDIVKPNLTGQAVPHETARKD